MRSIEWWHCQRPW